MPHLVLLTVVMVEVADATSGASDSSHSNETAADATSGASEH